MADWSAAKSSPGWRWLQHVFLLIWPGDFSLRSEPNLDNDHGWVENIIFPYFPLNGGKVTVDHDKSHGKSPSVGQTWQGDAAQMIPDTSRPIRFPGTHNPCIFWILLTRGPWLKDRSGIVVKSFSLVMYLLPVFFEWAGPRTGIPPFSAKRFPRWREHGWEPRNSRHPFSAALSQPEMAHKFKALKHTRLEAIDSVEVA